MLYKTAKSGISMDLKVDNGVNDLDLIKNHSILLISLFNIHYPNQFQLVKTSKINDMNKNVKVAANFILYLTPHNKAHCNFESSVLFVKFKGFSIGRSNIVTTNRNI